MPTFIEIWNRPLTTVSGNHFLSEALEICRGENVFAELRASAPKVTWEEVQSRNPMVIVGAGSASSLGEFRANWQLRQTMAAVRSERLLFVTDDKISRLTPRTPEGIANPVVPPPAANPASPTLPQPPATATATPVPATPAHPQAEASGQPPRKRPSQYGL